MKRFLFDAAKIVGSSTSQNWSQVHLFSSDEPEKQTQRGELIAVLSLAGLPDGIETIALGREIIARLHEEYYGNLKSGPLDRLAKAVEKVVAEITDGSGFDQLADFEIKAEINAGAVVGNVLYSATNGSGRVLILRDGQTEVAVQGSGSLKTASGYLKENDLVLIGTSGFFSLVADGVIKAAMASGDPAEVAEALAPAVSGHQDSGSAAAVVFRFDLAKTSEPAPELTLSEEPGEAPPAAVQSVGVEPLPVTTSKKRFSFPGRVLRLTLAGWLTRFQKRFKQRAVFLKEERDRLVAAPRRAGPKPERSKKMVFSVVLSLLFILAVAVFFGSKQRQTLQIKEKTDSLLLSAQEKLQQGEALVELNPSRAREFFSEAQELVAKIEAEGLDTQEFLDLKDKLARGLDKVVKEKTVQVREYFDLELIKQEASGDDWSVSGGKIFILDKQKKSIYEIGFEEKQSALVAGGSSFSQAERLAAYLPKVFVLSKDGVLSVDRLTDKEDWPVKLEDEGLSSVIDFQAFAGNLYMLDAKALWQYPAFEGGFGSRRSWLTGEAINFDEPVSMTIDGSIWVLESKGEILKFTRGKEDAFGVAGVETNFSQPAAIFTDDESENLYVLDKGSNQVVVISKTGEYQKSYSWEDVGSVSDLIALENENKILLLGGSKIWEIDL